MEKKQLKEKGKKKKRSNLKYNNEIKKKRIIRWWQFIVWEFNSVTISIHTIYIVIIIVLEPKSFKVSTIIYDKINIIIKCI